MNRGYTGHMLYAVVTVCALLLATFSSVGITQARYSNAAYAEVLYDQGVGDTSTLSSEKSIYDFGCWTTKDTAEDITHTIVLEEDAPLAGILRFTWDAVTAQERDVALARGNGDYLVEDADGYFELPISLVLNATTRSGTAILDVEWIPEGGGEASASARYLLTLNPLLSEETASDKVDTLFHSDTRFLTSRQLWLTLTVPSDYAGATFSPGMSETNTFPAGTRYSTEAYPRGITLLRDSVIYLPRQATGYAKALVEVDGAAAGETATFTASTSNVFINHTSQTVPTSPMSLSMSVGSPVAVVSKTRMLTALLTEAAAFRDGAWNSAATGETELIWCIERFSGGDFLAVTPGEDLTVTPSQTAEGGTLIIAAPTGKQPAGTYRLTVTQTYKGYLLNEITAWFFIDYR